MTEDFEVQDRANSNSKPDRSPTKTTPTSVTQIARPTCTALANVAHQARQQKHEQHLFTNVSEGREKSVHLGEFQLERTLGINLNCKGSMLVDSIQWTPVSGQQRMDEMTSQLKAVVPCR